MAEATKSKRARILTRLFLHDGEEHPKPRAGLNVNTIIFKYEDETETRVPLAPFFGGTLPPASVGRAAAAFGINTSAGNTIGTLEKDDDGNVHPADVKEAVEDRLKTFEAGRWADEAAGVGPGTTLRLDTLVKFKTEVLKSEATDEWVKTMRQKLEDDKDWWKTLMSDPSFRSVHEALKAERATARAKAAAEKVGTAQSTLSI